MGVIPKDNFHTIQSQVKKYQNSPKSTPEMLTVSFQFEKKKKRES